MKKIILNSTALLTLALPLLNNAWSCSTSFQEDSLPADQLTASAVTAPENQPDLQAEASRLITSHLKFFFSDQEINKLNIELEDAPSDKALMLKIMNSFSTLREYKDVFDED